MKLNLFLTIALATVLGAAACRWNRLVIWCYQFKHCQKGPAIKGVTLQQCLSGGPGVIFGCYAQWGPNNEALPNGADTVQMCNCAEKKMEECYEDYGADGAGDPEAFDACRTYALKDVDCDKFGVGGERENDAIYADCKAVNDEDEQRKLQVDNELPACFMNGDGVLGGGGSFRCIDEEADDVELCASPDVNVHRPWEIHGNEIDLTVFEWEKRNDPNKVKFLKIIVLTCNVWAGGDPHIKKWDGGWYEWHGQCDSVMLNVPDYGFGMGLTVHARTKTRYDYSFIETAAIQIGDDILEVSGFGNYFLNGVNQAEMPAAISSNHFVTHEQVDENDHKYEVDLGKGITLDVKTHKDTVSLSVNVGYGADTQAFANWFKNSTGLMGSFPHGEMLARDGRVLTDPNEMGQEWQVLDTESKLFQDQDRHPQYPSKCTLPSPDALQTRRRLLGDSISQESAEEACSGWNTAGAKDRCIHDVIATGDLSMAVAGSY